MPDPFRDISSYDGWLRFIDDKGEEFRVKNIGAKMVKVWKLENKDFVYQGRYTIKGMFNIKNVYNAYIEEGT